MRKYCERWIYPTLKRKTEENSAVVVTGARQVGKTTLLKKQFPEWDYLTLDDYSLLAELKRDPEFPLLSKQPVIIDEVQRYPDIFLTIKKIIDDRPESKFLLSGSANLLLMEKVSESLAGRAVFVELGPLSQGEILALPPASIVQELFNEDFSFLNRAFPSCADLPHRVWHGGMPQIYQRQSRAAIVDWFEGYVTTYLEKDLRQLSQIENLSDFRQLMIAATLRIGDLLNTSELGRDVALKQSTAHRYINLLEVSGLMFRLPAYAVSRGKRLVKSPKIMWLDSGLASYLSGHYSWDSLQNSREWGGMLESFVFQELKQLAGLMTPSPHIFYWRTFAGHEVDFVLEFGQSLVGVEVKSSPRVTYGDSLPLQQFLNDYPKARCGVILHSGEKNEEIARNVYALPISSLWTHEDG